MYGAVCQRHAPEPTGREAEHGGSTHRGDRGGEEQAATGESEGGDTTDANRGGRRSRVERAAGKRFSYHTRRLAAQRGEERITKQQHRQRGEGRMGTSQDTTRPRRIITSRRYTETGFTLTLAPTLTAISATMRRCRRGGVTSRSCHRGAMTGQAGELGGTLSGRSAKTRGGCGTYCGTRSGSSSFRR